MATIGALSFTGGFIADIASIALDYLVRGGTLLQTQQDRPLLAWLNSGQKTFPSGKQFISEPVQGAVMSDTAGFFAGYTNDDTLSFAQASNATRATFPWKETHAGFVITLTELKQDGISIDQDGNTSEHADVQLTRLVNVLENRMNDFAESWARSLNNMYWADGSQDAKQVPGLRSLLVDDPTAGTVGSIAQATNSWWRSRANLSLAASADNQTLSKFCRNELIQLKRYGGKPNKILCGSAAWDAFMQEVSAKGLYTQSGFTGTNDIGMDTIAIKGIGTISYDPTLDDRGDSKRFYILDGRRIKKRPMDGEDAKKISPARPYQYMVMLQSMTHTAALEVTQLNANGVYSIA